MKKNVVNTILILLVAALLTVLALYVRTGATVDAVAVLKTGGMTCGSCSTSITAALKQQQGVGITEVDVAGGWVVVGYDSHAVTPQALAETVKGAGFTSAVQTVLTPEQFKQITGRDLGRSEVQGGCCGKGGCGMKKRS